MIGHSAFWPAYRRRSLRSHTLALCDDEGRLSWLGQGSELVTVECQSYSEWRGFVTTNRLDVFCRDLTAFRWLPDAAAHPKDTVLCCKNSLDFAARAACITLRQGNNWGSLHESKVWGSHEYPTAALLKRLVALFEHLESGVYPTPGALGQETMRRHSHGRHTAPCPAVCDDLRAGLVGGRCDLWDGSRRPFAFEYDRNAAYVSECLYDVPTRTAIPLSGGLAPWEWEDQPWFTYYVRCTVLIREKLLIGPFGVREPSGIVRYPVEPGLYVGIWLWRHEVEECLSLGCMVNWERTGAAWERGEPILREWAEWILGKRASAPRRIAGMVKLVGVAGIGWFGMGDTLYRMVDRAPDDTDVATLLIESGEQGGRIGMGEVIALPKVDSQMIHWASWIWSMARFRLYRRALAEIQDGNPVLSTNFDSLIVAQPSRLPVSGEPGEWRLEATLTNAEQPYIRALVSAEKRRTPGIPGRGANETDHSRASDSDP